MSGESRKRTDRWRVIKWLMEDLEYYKENIGQVKEHGKKADGIMSKTVIDQKLIDTVEKRIEELKEKELELV